MLHGMFWTRLGFQQNSATSATTIFVVINNGFHGKAPGTGLAGTCQGGAGEGLRQLRAEESGLT